MRKSIKDDLEKILAALSRVFADEGDTAAVTVLALSNVTMELWNGWNNSEGFRLTFEVGQPLFNQIGGDRERIQTEIRDKFNTLTPQYPDQSIENALITPELVADDKWREKAKAWITGQGISNQGRARSDNLAPRACDGLLFRSLAEIQLYRAFKALGVSFAPLPVFVRGGETYRRIEPDFVIIKDGVVLIVEVDGDTVHRESPQEAHTRVTMLLHEGVHIERVNAKECETPEKAKQCAAKILRVIDKLKANK